MPLLLKTLRVSGRYEHKTEEPHVRSVGGGKHNDTSVALKAIHLGQQLVDGLLTLVIATSHSSTTLAANRINLIDEDNARRLLLGLQNAKNTVSTRAVSDIILIHKPAKALSVSNDLLHLCQKQDSCLETLSRASRGRVRCFAKAL